MGLATADMARQERQIALTFAHGSLSRKRMIFFGPVPTSGRSPAQIQNAMTMACCRRDFFTHIRDKILQAHLRRRLNRVQRSE